MLNEFFDRLFDYEHNQHNQHNQHKCPFLPSDYGVSISDQEQEVFRKRADETTEGYKKRSFCLEMLLYNEQKHLTETINLYHLFVTEKQI